MNNFDNLVKVALDEALVSDYIRAASRAVTHTAANAVKGAARTADVLASKSGMQYNGQWGSIASKASAVGSKMKEWGIKHKAEIEKRDLNSIPYKLLATQQDKKLLPVVGENISTVMPDTKQIVRMQVVDIKTDAIANKEDEKNKSFKVNGGVTIISQPVEQGNGKSITQFDTAITKINDINRPLQSTTITTFLKNNAATRISQLNAIVTRKEHDPLFGNQTSWQLRAPSLKPESKIESNVQPEDHKSIYTNTESNSSYIFRGIREGG